MPTRHPSLGVTPVRLLLPAFLAILVLAVPLARSAAAADAYRYWSYYQLTGGSWAFAQKGVEASVPADGTVEGYRFAIGDMTTTRNPRLTPSFEAVCASTPAQPDMKRVAVVVDYGRAADARDGAEPPAPAVFCALVEPSATAAKVLAGVTQVRTEKSMLCSIGDYPRSGPCTETVATVPAAAAAPDTPLATTPTPASAEAPSSAATQEATSTSPWAWLSLILVVAAIGAAAVVSIRRRRA